MASTLEGRFPFHFESQAKRLLWFFFSTSTHAKGKVETRHWTKILAVEHALVQRGITPQCLWDKYKCTISVWGVSLPWGTKSCHQHKAWERSGLQRWKYSMGCLKLLQSHQEKQRLQKPQWVKNDSQRLSQIQPSIN